MERIKALVKKIRIKRAIFLSAFIIAITIVQAIAIGAITNEKRETKVRDTYIYGQSIANAVQLTLDNTLEATETLKYFYLQYGEKFFDEFDEIAANIIKDTPLIDSMYMAPDGVIQVAYPDTVKDSTIGFEMLKDPKQGPYAQLAIDTGEITVAGPHNLVEGGKGFIIRNPIFVEGQFKGFAIAVLNWDKFVEQALRNTPLSAESYKYGIWKEKYDETAVTDKNGYVFSNCDERVSDRVDIEIYVPNDVWHMNIEPVSGFKVMGQMKFSLAVSITMASCCILLVAMGMVSYDRKKLLQKELAEKEAKSIYMGKLSEALEKAKQADESKSVFLSNMSHDIRTPMNAILGFSRMIEKEIDDKERILEYLKKIQYSGDYLLTIINNILDMARIESGKATLDEEPFDLHKESESIVSMFEEDIKKKNLHFSHSVDVTHQYVYGDITKKNQIWINLLSNSIKYTPEGGSISLNTIEIPCEKPGYASYVTTLSDTGVGMSKEFLEHIYDSFSREKNTTESKVIGTGLGMSIVKKLVVLMGGTIEIQSEPGKGSAFTVTMTHRIAENAKDYIENQQKEQAVSVDCRGKRVLLAEDNELNAEIAISILEDIGLSVEWAKDGVDCIDMLNRAVTGYYDVILMDIQMPNLNGYMATRKIRQMKDQQKAQIPIIALTANAFEEDRKEAFNAGMDAHLTKPIVQFELMKVLSKVFKNSN